MVSMSKAACLGSDTGLWFAKFVGRKGGGVVATADARRAIEICEACPVRAECRDEADRRDTTYGILGGEPAHERYARWEDEGVADQHEIPSSYYQGLQRREGAK